MKLQQGPRLCQSRSHLSSKSKIIKAKALELIFASFSSYFRQSLTLKLAWISTYSISKISSMGTQYIIIFQNESNQSIFRHKSKQFEYFSNKSSSPIIAHSFIFLLIIECLCASIDYFWHFLIPLQNPEDTTKNDHYLQTDLCVV